MLSWEPSTRVKDEACLDVRRGKVYDDRKLPSQLWQVAPTHQPILKPGGNAGGSPSISWKSEQNQQNPSRELAKQWASTISKMREGAYKAAKAANHPFGLILLI